METNALLSLGALIALTIHFTSYGSAVVTSWCKHANRCVVDKTSATEKDSNEHGPTKIFIPNLLVRWPWPRRINPHHAAVAKESVAWVASFAEFSPKVKQAFARCDFDLFACLTYPLAKKEHVRVCCDYMNVIFVIDEYSEVFEPSEVRKQKDIVMDALRNPHKMRLRGEWIGGEMTRQFWERAIRNTSDQFQKRFIMVLDETLEGAVQQAIDRSEHHIRDIKNYIDLRRKTSCILPSFALLELALDIPDDVMSHPAIQDMILSSTDMIMIGNDILSYNLERYRGDDTHNILRVAMNEFGTDLNGAMLWVQDLHTKAEQTFRAAMAALPEWEEPLNSQVKEYCNGLGNWVRGNIEWGFESGRYFGDRGLEIKEKGWMDLMPPKGKSGTAEVDPTSLL